MKPLQAEVDQLVQGLIRMVIEALAQVVEVVPGFSKDADVTYTIKWNGKKENIILKAN